MKHRMVVGLLIGVFLYGGLAFIPLPVESANTPASQTFVNKPIPVCPANSDPDGGGERGIGVVMPLTPTNANEYYKKLRRLVTDSERKESKRASKRNGRTSIA